MITIEPAFNEQKQIEFSISKLTINDLCLLVQWAQLAFKINDASYYDKQALQARHPTHERFLELQQMQDEMQFAETVRKQIDGAVNDAQHLIVKGVVAPRSPLLIEPGKPL
ncbi:MAG TPA: hypothetical protein PLO59_00050 [Bacteroidia bacterium]|nr:hypothetical protein [Bacteroidia bacterium]